MKKVTTKDKTTTTTTTSHIFNIKKPQPVDVKQLSTIKMVAGGEQRHPIVIDDGVIKNWVGFGWVTGDAASEDDYYKYPEVQRY
jgi:hypothetical protein